MLGEEISCILPFSSFIRRADSLSFSQENPFSPFTINAVAKASALIQSGEITVADIIPEEAG